MKRVVVTGSIATDHLMTFPARFADQLIADKLARVSLSFLVDRLDVRRGGVAANIAFGLGCLGMSPVLVGAVGADFADYSAWLRLHRVDTRFVHVSKTLHTARFLCTTDIEQNQIASFYAGAMSEAREIELSPIVDRLESLELVLIAPNDPAAMLRHTEECRARGFGFAADPSQQLARMSAEDLRTLISGARYLFTNEYEHALLLAKTGYAEDDVLTRVGAWITTLGAAGVQVRRAGAAPISVDAIPPVAVVDPTGAGDGFRAGFLYGVASRLPAERAVQLGCLVATSVLETMGTQEYLLDRNVSSKRAAAAYGADAAAEIESVLRIWS